MGKIGVAFYKRHDWGQRHSAALQDGRLKAPVPVMAARRQPLREAGHSGLLRGFLQLCEFLGLAVEEFFAAVAGFFLADDAFAGSKPDGAAEFDFAIVAGG